MRTTLNLDKDVLDAARNLARRRQITLGAAVSELARKGLSTGSGPSSTIGKDMLPKFHVAEEAPSFGTDDVTRALNEDDP